MWIERTHSREKISTENTCERLLHPRIVQLRARVLHPRIAQALERKLWSYLLLCLLLLVVGF